MTIASPPSLNENPQCQDWVDLSHNGRVTLKSGKVEIGQGIATALVQIAADELDVDPGQFDLIAGHTSLGPVEAGTSSSLSVETGGQAVRLAAAAVRSLLLDEAAKLLQAPKTELSVDNGRISVGERATDLTYWTLAPTVDLSAPVLDHASPKAPNERRLVGTSMARIDLLRKAASAGFIHDLDLPNMLHGRVLDPPTPGRRLLTMDDTSLKAAFPNAKIVRDGSFVGVLAAQEDEAVQCIAALRMRAQWSDAEGAPNSLAAAIAADSSSVEEVFRKGDAASAEGRVVRTQIERPYLAHASIAPSCAIARWRGGCLEVHSHSQAVHDLRSALAMAFNLDPAKVTVIHGPGAGTYGHSGQDDVAYEAALLARAVPGEAVRVLWSRFADFALSPLGPGMIVTAEAKVSAGQITAFSIQSVGQAHVFRPGRGGTVNFIAAERLSAPLPKGRASDVPLSRGGGADRNANPLYAIPNVHVSKRVLHDLPYRTSALRALGGYANIFAIETLMDDIAIEIGSDPIALRLSHLQDKRAASVLEEAAMMAGWPGAPVEGEGLGVGLCQYKNRSAYCAVVAKVMCGEQIRLTHAWAAVDAGEAINPDGIVNQIEGGIIQSASWTLLERVALNGDAVSTHDWDTYPIMRFSEVPEIEVRLLSRAELPPLGVGEAATGATAAAIGNAVRQALGIRIRKLPITRDAVLAASAS
ncbi:MAG: molybdopterin-dependent oxidoreductase [Rhodospirillales bacterium]|nr:molybdopterin-dependent oxidoreductase [Rhodospirillales bacterium]